MNLTEIKKSLTQAFAREPSQGARRNIIFWYDEDAAFAQDVAQLALEGVEVVELTPNNMFAVKFYIEVEQQECHLLVYSPHPRPTNRENWLADTIKYSQLFYTDEASNTMLVLGMDNGLHHVMTQYKLFFRNNERFKRFESYHVNRSYSETSIVIGIHAALCKLPVPTLDGIVKALLLELAAGETLLLDSMEKYGSMDALWDLIRKAYGYAFPENSLPQLAVMLLSTHLAQSLHGTMPNEWQTYVSSNANGFVFTDNLMRNAQQWDGYNALSEFVSQQLNIDQYASKWTVDDVAECDTFQEFDQLILTRIRENMEQGVSEFGHYRKLIHSRKNRRFYAQFAREYEVLLHVCEYLELAAKHRDLYIYSLEGCFEEYVNGYYRIDSAYRHFIVAYDQLTDTEAYQSLRDVVENSYTNWYLHELSMGWCNLLDEQPWQVPEVCAQQDFYSRYVQRSVLQDERIVVVISDGLRYESAVELNAQLNRGQKGVSELEVMLGVLPSVTALGMASLLPHKTIAYTEKGDVEVDGISSKGTENRGKILRQYKAESIAVQFDDMIDLSKQEMGELFAGKKLIYIYHNVVDARGDNASTEHEVFDATEKTFGDVDKLVRKLRNTISAINILITADHGYLYRRTKLEQRDKTSKEADNVLAGGRRYLVSRAESDRQGTQCFSLGYLNRSTADLFATVPRAINCFKVQGAGSCYVHGGTSLQETVIPVIRFKSDKNLRQSMGAKKVSLDLTNLSRKITNVITHLTFFQGQSVDEKNLPLRVTAYFVDEAGNRISNENIIIADSNSQIPEERTYKEKFTLKDMAYDKSKEYFLVLIDEDEMVNKEIARMPFAIDLVFGGSIQF
ncbi:BREX-1 system phosphatase PglZ type A [Bengtsoniella intestinalis]|uniref:BREX-1 system phosphatase PglZ type A n=1 Tax=Bengtsoniella intestinalis TaxID=3073143 RepID=UPI00391FC5A0